MIRGEMTDPCIVDGPGLSKLVPLLAKAFSEVELEELIRLTFSEGLFEEYVPSGLTLRDLVFKLVEALERRGTTDIFLRAVLTVRPRRSDLADLVLRLCPSAAEPETETKAHVEVVLGGLTVIKENVDAHDSIHKLETLRPKVGQLVDGFTRMASSVRWIDCLTQIELEAQLLESLAEGFTDQTSHAQISSRMLLQEAELVKLSRDAPIEFSSDLRWFDRILELISKIREAIASKDAAGCNDAVDEIGRLTGFQLGRHTALLQLTAEDLPLDDLIQVITDVRDYAGLDPISAAAINLSLQALQHLYPRVRGLATRQKRWRNIEQQLSLILLTGPDDELSESARDWFVTAHDVRRLVQMDPEAASFTTSIQDHMAKVDNFTTLIKKNNDAMIENNSQSFRTTNIQFRREVQFESLRVSSALYSLCRDILQLLQPLKSLLAVLSR
jgi:hypothetical protein